MSFWTSELGTLSGEAKDAFAKTFKVIPDGTTAVAKIVRFYYEENNSKTYYAVEWELIDGDFKGQHVFQKIHAFDNDPKKKHRALNMMMLLYKMYGLKPDSNVAPNNKELAAFQGKIAGIKIQEWSAPREDGSMMEGNWVSEVNPAEGFKSETGIKAEVVHTRPGVESAFSRNSQQKVETTDDIPF